MNPTSPAATTASAPRGDRFRLSIAAFAAAVIAMAVAMPPHIAGELGTSWTTPTAASVVDIDAGLVEALADGASATAIIRTVEGAQAGVVGAVETAGGELITPLPLVDGFLARVDAAVVDAIRALGGAAVSVSLDRPVELHHTAPDGQSYDDGFYTETIGATKLHAEGYDGSGVGIAFIDTGIMEVPDLMGRVVHAADFSGEDDGVDRFGHGTFSAGVAAGSGLASDGQYAGVAPGARLISIKIAGEDGATDVSRVLAAIQYAVIHKTQLGIDVLNLPIGTDSSQSWTADPLNFAVQRAWHAGIVVVVAAGNTGSAPGTIMKPGDDPYVITVGASDSESTVERGDDTVPAFSSRGPTRTDGLSKPDVVAPGAHIIGTRAAYSAIDQLAPHAAVGEYYFRGSGTSFSAAATSGAVALLKQKHPGWSPDQIKGALLGSAATGPANDRNVDGFGAVDVSAAAAHTQPPAANVGLSRASGQGSMGRARGKQTIELQKDDGTEEILDARSNRTAQGKAFDLPRFTGASWQGASWQDTQWAGASWQGASWQGASWQAFSWAGASWQGASWQGASWQGASWQGASWQDLSWQGSSWQGVSWQ